MCFYHNTLIKMITEIEYKKAIEIINQYKNQIISEVNEISKEIEGNPLNLLKKGTKIKIISIGINTKCKIGDIYEVYQSYYNHHFKISPIIVFKNKNGHKCRISKEKNGWDYEVLS